MKNLGYCSSSKTTIVIFIHVVTILVTQYLTQRTEAFDPLIQLPRSTFTRTRTRTRPRSRRVISVIDFAAKGDGLHNDTQVITKLFSFNPIPYLVTISLPCFQSFLEAWKTACSFPGFANVDVPYGKTFLIYPVDIAGHCKSKITLRILGTIVAPKDPAVWNGLNQRKWLYFHGVNHLTVEGGGSINGMGHEWWARSCKTNSTIPCHPAPTALTFHKCKNLKVKNLTLLNSQQMHLAFTSCMRVVASHLRVLAPPSSPNTDGVHISVCKGVEVRDTVIRTGDDCISIVRNSSRVWIRNITCGPGHGISIGSLGKSNVWEKAQDIYVNGAYLSNTDNGVRIKTWQGGAGFASKITFQNILMENVSNPIIIDQYYCDSPKPCKNQTSAVKVESISFINVQGTSATKEAIKFACSDTSPCEGLYLENISIVSASCSFIGNTSSYCWQAYGSTQGFVYPPSCLLSNDNFIKQSVSLGSKPAAESI
ncbi:probable polygalacturonase At1g80170 isoform X3 [Arachis stenosperma]|uniref:probable polygalacturonase At1g80170 isoform X3 n=1 Tax=Arachis stenosperma TaxID=217475 RepID=UPI0025AC4985|nr:probable polygalacturonase At1g80170 isoform X3 [Arachis stenosperma]